MSLTITIDRTPTGGFRAEIADDPRLVIERADLGGLVEELKQNLDRIAVTPNGALLVSPPDDSGPIVLSTGEVFPDEESARAAVQKRSLRNEEWDEIIARYPPPVEWADEPGWSDELSEEGRGRTSEPKIISL